MTDTSASLTGKVALVTGASRGLGKAIAIELGSQGATVYVTARSYDSSYEGIPGTVAETAELVTAAGGRGIAIQCDHAVDADMQAVADRIKADEGGLDLLVNNAFPSGDSMSAMGPTWGGKPFWETPVDSWDAFFTIAVRGHYVATQLAMPLLIERQGLVVNLSSCGAVTYLMSPLYGAGKEAGDRLMRDLAHEVTLVGAPVSIVSIWPGIVDTEFVGSMFRENPSVVGLLARGGWAGFDDVDEKLAALDDEGLIALTESPAFAGRAVAALLGDPDVGAKHGRRLPVSLLADEYGFTDVDGRSPDAFRFREPAGWRGSF